jgi:hypothetical protein
MEGGTLALLAAMTTKRFRAAASLSGSPDQVLWARGKEHWLPFDPDDQREFQVRSPLAYPRSFKCPVRLYHGAHEPLFLLTSPRLAQKAQAADLDVEAIQVSGDEATSLFPAMRQCIQFFQQH